MGVGLSPPAAERRGVVNTKVIFLDVDGVLNRCGKSFNQLEPQLLAKLLRIVCQTGADVCVSSTWRLFRHLLDGILLPALDEYGITPVGVTPDLCSKKFGGTLWAASTRGEEIVAWLKDHPQYTQFVILDDNADMGYLLPHLVRTDSFTGLEDRHVQEAIHKLKGGDAQCSQTRSEVKE